MGIFSDGGMQSLRCDASKELFRRCHEALQKCDAVVALLDGPMVDDGTAWEKESSESGRIFGEPACVRELVPTLG